MVFHKKEPAMPEITRKTATFSAFSASAAEGEKKGALSWTECLNFTFRDGALTGEIGTKAVCINNPIKNYSVMALYFYDSPEKSETIFLTPAGLYRIAFPMTATSSVTRILSKVFTAPPCGIAYESKAQGKYLLLLYGEGGLYVYDGNSVTNYAGVPVSKGACRYNDRLFLLSAATPGRVCFSKPSDETDWTAAYAGAGYIDLDPGEGEIRGIFSGENGVWLLRDGLVTHLKADGENNDFSLVHTPIHCGKIYGGSAQSFGDGCVFLCDDGLYAFDDGELTAIRPDITAGLSVGAGDICSGVWNSLYFVAYTDTDGNTRVLFASPRERKAFFGDFGVEKAVRRKNECYFLQGGTLASFTTESGGTAGALRKVYKSAPTDFGLGTARKLLREVTLEGEGDFTLTILSEDAKKSFSLSLKKGSSRACPVLKGRLFTFSIESSSAKCNLKKLSATVDLPQGGGR